nr:hypothetical protein [uncultured Dongia sp.]
MINEVKRFFASLRKWFNSRTRTDDEIIRWIEEEMEFLPTISKATEWSSELEKMELQYLRRDSRSPMQMRRLVEAKGRIYDLIHALENGHQVPHVAYYRHPIQLLKEELDRTRLWPGRSQ